MLTPLIRLRNRKKAVVGVVGSVGPVKIHHRMMLGSIQIPGGTQQGGVATPYGTGKMPTPLTPLAPKLTHRKKAGGVKPTLLTPPAKIPTPPPGLARLPLKQWVLLQSTLRPTRLRGTMPATP